MPQTPCGYRHCDLPSQHRYCSAEHRRREKLFRSGKASDLSYFRNPDPIAFPNAERFSSDTCQTCKSRFQYKSGSKRKSRCQGCIDRSRDKSCTKCQGEFRDESRKNTRKYCDQCSNKPPRKAKISSRTTRERKRRVALGLGGRIDDLSTLTPLTPTWWGRVGELLFLSVHPDALDAVAVYGSNSPFDAESLATGRVDVKTSKMKITRQGKSSWSFGLRGLRLSCDTAFLIGFSEDRNTLTHAWSIPAVLLPKTVKTLTPESSEYTSKEHEVEESIVGLMNSRFQRILRAHEEDQRASPIKSDPEYSRHLLGKIGESVYFNLFPSSNHVAKADPLSTYDFIDEDGDTVNVRVRRPYVSHNRDRWTFFVTPGCTADYYFFMGMDAMATEIQVALRVSQENMPTKGFSLTRGSTESSWLKYAVDLGLPRRLDSIIDVSDLDEVNLAVNSSLTERAVAKMSPKQTSKLLRQAIAYYRTVGFPYPKKQDDAKVIGELNRIRLYRGNEAEKTYPIDNSGLGICSAYMPHRYSAKNINAKTSAEEAFESNQRLMRALSFATKGKNPSLRPRAVRSALTALNRTPTQFRPSIAAALCHKYSRKGDAVFDPCAGWGGRLTGTLATGRRYFGVDLSQKTAEGLYRIGSRLCELLNLDRKEAFKIIHGDSTVVDLHIAEADFAMTSPPYWDQEIYDDSARLTLDEWNDQFLRPMIKRVFSILRSGKIFAINIADIRRGRKLIPLVDMAILSAIDAGFEHVDTWTMAKSSFGIQEKRSGERILILEKPLSIG